MWRLKENGKQKVFYIGVYWMCIMSEVQRVNVTLPRKLLDKSIDKIFQEEKGKGFDTSGLTQEELIKRIRKTRNELWDEKYREWFEGLS